VAPCSLSTLLTGGLRGPHLCALWIEAGRVTEYLADMPRYASRLAILTPLP
jgi:hypothetical protein